MRHAESIYIWFPGTGSVWVEHNDKRQTNRDWVADGGRQCRGSDEPDVIALYRRIIDDNVPEEALHKKFMSISEYQNHVDRVGRHWGATQVGKGRFYWAVYNLSEFMFAMHGYGGRDRPASPNPSWLIGEGFEPTLDAAKDAARAVDVACGWPKGRYYRDSTQTLYKERHGRKPDLAAVSRI